MSALFAVTGAKNAHPLQNSFYTQVQNILIYENRKFSENKKKSNSL